MSIKEETIEFIEDFRPTPHTQVHEGTSVQKIDLAKLRSALLAEKMILDLEAPGPGRRFEWNRSS